MPNFIQCMPTSQDLWRRDTMTTWKKKRSLTLDPLCSCCLSGTSVSLFWEGPYFPLRSTTAPFPYCKPSKTTIEWDWKSILTRIRKHAANSTSMMERHSTLPRESINISNFHSTMTSSVWRYFTNTKDRESILSVKLQYTVSAGNLQGFLQGWKRPPLASERINNS